MAFVMLCSPRWDSINGMDSSPQADRALSSTVCALCRQRKIRCDRHKPACGFCFENGFTCEYVRSQKKPGVRAGYVSELAKRVAKLERNLARLQAQQDNQGRLPANIDPERSTGNAPESSLNPVLADESPSCTADAPSSRDEDLPGVDALFTHACDMWFEEYHQWFPVLHQPSVKDSLRFCQGNPHDPSALVLQALAVTTLPALYAVEWGDVQARQKWSRALRLEVIQKSMEQLSFPGLQAMLILSINDFGLGKISEFWNLVALCQRMSTQLGLRDLVVNYCSNYGQPSTIPPRMLTVPSTVVECEERVRVFWATGVLDSASTIGTAWNVHLSFPEIAGFTPGPDNMWHLPEGERSVYPFGDSETPSAFSFYVRLVSTELWHVHNFLQQSYDVRSAPARAGRQANCLTVDQRLQHWRVGFENLLTATSPMGPVLGLTDARTSNPNVILTYCTLDLAIIALYQRLVLSLTDAESTSEVWYHAVSRCLECCDEITQMLRNLPDDAFRCMHPQLIVCIFVAARFYIISVKVTSTRLSPKTDLLVYALNSLAQRWPLAARLEKVIRAAMTGRSDVNSQPPLPQQFFDLQYVWPDIDDALATWAEIV